MRSDLGVTDHLHSGQRTAGTGLIFCGSRSTINVTSISHTIINQYFFRTPDPISLFMAKKQKSTQRCASVCVWMLEQLKSNISELQWTSG